MSEAAGAVGAGLADSDDIPLADADGEEVKPEPIEDHAGQAQGYDSKHNSIL